VNVDSKDLLKDYNSTTQGFEDLKIEVHRVMKVATDKKVKSGGNLSPEDTKDLND
jgi:hypothetical protein